MKKNLVGEILPGRFSASVFQTAWQHLLRLGQSSLIVGTPRMFMFSAGFEL